METFDIPVRRTAHQFATLSVQAQTQEEANEKALDQAGDHEFSGEKSADYFLVNQGDGVRRKKALTASAAAFLSDEEDPASQYERLLDASENGHGLERAGDHVRVWLPLENFEVDTLIGIIEKHADSIFEILD